ncbi:MAG: glycoside hydrolase family 16 protein [Polyangiaceae bacterium]|nr:glycoside hydrolase family 16 protein [Myxococcales bacterium]MCB9589838.1 glycoside hydrolase family 16 protein [Polyangiaceae bacterium]
MKSILTFAAGVAALSILASCSSDDSSGSGKGGTAGQAGSAGLGGAMIGDSGGAGGSSAGGSSAGGSSGSAPGGSGGSTSSGGAAGSSTGGSAGSATGGSAGAGGSNEHGSLVFSDEFEGSDLDRSVWCTRYIYGGGATPQVADPECQKNGAGTLDFLNDEQQRYVDTNRDGEKAHQVSGGVLSLRATKTRSDSYASYESGMIRSKWLFKPSTGKSYYIVSRVRLPDVVGSWPAFWLNSDWRPDGTTTWPPEIDIIDAAYNGVEDRAEMLHQAGVVQGQQTASGSREITFSAPEFDRQWSNYIATTSQRGVWLELALEWTPEDICYFVDGYKTLCENYRWRENGGAEAAPAHILLNLAIGGQWAGRHGVDDTKLPTTFDIDYVRVYEHP